MLLLLLILFVEHLLVCDAFLRTSITAQCRNAHRPFKFVNYAANLKENMKIETVQSLLFKNVYEWLTRETLDSLAPREELIAMLIELRTNEENEKELFELFDIAWTKFSAQVAEENRSLTEILGPTSSGELLDYVESIDIYDPITVKALLGSPVFESMMGSILYEAIFMFLKRVDIIGNIVNKLPIIGPIRLAIVSEFKKSLDRTVGEQIKSFLSSFNKIAVQRMVDFLLSPTNRQALNKANRNVVQSILNRPVSESFPLSGTSENVHLKQSLWKGITSTTVEDSVSVINSVYDRSGDKLLSGVFLTSFDDVVNKSKHGQAMLSDNIIRFLSTEEGKLAFEALGHLKREAEKRELIDGSTAK